MKMLQKLPSRPRHFRRFILTASIVPAVLVSSALGADVIWNGVVNLNTGDPGLDIVHVTGNATVTLTNTGPISLLEDVISFEPAIATELLTVNGPGLELRSNSTVLSIANTKTITVAGTANFAPGALYTGPTVGTATDTAINFVKDGGAGTLLLDNPTNALAGTTLKVINGLLSIVGGGPGLNPVSSLTTQIDIGNSSATSTTAVLRIGSSGGDMNFPNLIKVTRNGTLEHVSSTNDTISGNGSLPTLGIVSNRTLTVNVTAGSLNITGSIADPDSTSIRGGTLKKTGVGTTLKLSGETFINVLNVQDGRVEIPANARLRVNATTGLTLGPTGTLSVLNTNPGTPNNLPTTINVPAGATLEGLPGAFVTASSTQSILNLTGGTLNLGVNIGPPTPGLAAQLYSTGSGAAQLAFGGPQYPGNTYATYVNYFAGITPAAVTSTGAGGVTELSFVNDSNFTWTGSGPTDVTTPYGNIRMYETIAPTYTRNDEIVSRFKGKIVITAPGAYTFATNADDGSMLYIDGGTVVSNNASQGHTRRTGTVALAPGLHDIDIGYYEGGGLNGIIVDYNGPDTGGVATTVPNSVLLPLGSAPTAFLNPVTVTGNSIINAGNGASVASLSLSVTKVVNVNGYQLDMGPLTLTGGAGLYTINVNTQYAEVCARSISDGGVDADLVNNGPGMLILESGASPQLQNPGSSVTSAALGIVLGGAGGSPTGNATVNVNGGSLVLSSKGGDQSYSPVGISFTNGGNIAAGKICEGIAGTVGTPIRTTLTPALTVNNTKTLSLSTRDNYILKVGAISGGGSVSIPAGTVETSGAVTLTGTGQFTVANSKVSTLAGVSAGAITVTDSTLTNTGTLTSASSLTITNSTVTTSAGATAASIAVNSSKLISTGAIATGAGGITLTGASSTLATLELHGGSISGGAITGQGASVHVTSGVTTATTSANFTGFNPTGLKGRFIVTGGGGQISRGDTQSGILTIETGTNGLVEKVLNQPLNFPQDSDGPISVFFNGANTGPGFAMGFFGNFTAPTTGLYTLQTGLNDDDAGFWVDLDGDGVFEGGNVGGTPGANGNELIAWASCCGDGANQHPGTVMLTQGNLYKVGIAVEDGQGGSGLVGRITAPGGSIMIVDPSSAAQPGWWTYGQPNQLTVDAGAELKIPKIDGSVSVLVNGKLEINGASSTFDSLSIGSGGIVTLGAGGPAPGELAGAALAVPEPGSVSLMLLGVLGCLGRRERVSRD